MLLYYYQISSGHRASVTISKFLIYYQSMMAGNICLSYGYCSILKNGLVDYRILSLSEEQNLDILLCMGSINWLS